VREFEWSPDGKSIAFSRIDEATAEEKKRAEEKDDARVAGQGAKHVHLYVADVDSGTIRRLTNGAFTIWAFSWSPDGTEIAFDRGPGTGLDDLYRTDIYSVNVASGALKPLVVRPGSDRNPVHSPDGRWIAFTTWNGAHDWLVEQEVHVVPAGGGESRNVSKTYDRTPEVVFWSDAHLYIEGPYNTTTQLYRVNADGRGWTDVTNVPGMIGDAHVHRGRMAYTYQSPTEPPELFVEKTLLTHHNDAYRTRELGETRVIRWKNPKDGLEIEGLLTLPVGYKSERVPLLTFVHGGPASRFDQGYLGYLGHVYAPQVLAANGFAVLRPNPRGTGGYGSAFRRANRNDWGGMDWIDINAGIDQLIAEGIADPDRLGLMGWSYGGFMAAWALGHSDRFKPSASAPRSSTSSASTARATSATSSPATSEPHRHLSMRCARTVTLAPEENECEGAHPTQRSRRPRAALARHDALPHPRQARRRRDARDLPRTTTRPARAEAADGRHEEERGVVSGTLARD
jgi:dipeptidyl aminopeptidase/acylaminoacyl peptidase